MSLFWWSVSVMCLVLRMSGSFCWVVWDFWSLTIFLWLFSVELLSSLGTHPSLGVSFLAASFCLLRSPFISLFSDGDIVGLVVLGVG